jgi:NAD(P)-dependent dehydrogenase (short-subunit alcohol dehydrogenase family)
MTFSIDLSGSRALVTGGGQGVGRAISLTLASAGASLVVNDYVAERAEAVADEIRAAGGDAVAAPFDVTDFDAVIDGVGTTGGTIDVLINNAGNAGVAGFDFAPFHESAPADWERYFGVNLYGVMHCTRAVLPAMIDKAYGRIVTIISDAGRWGEPRMAAYSAAKAGAAGFTRSLARDVGRYGVTVNNIALASIDPAGARSEGADMTEEQADALGKQLRNYIIRRRGRPDDVAAMAVFLASPLTSWITGQTYPVNGGYTVNQ